MRPNSPVSVALALGLCFGTSAVGCRPSSNGPLAPAQAAEPGAPVATPAEPTAGRAGRPEAPRVPLYGYFRIARPSEFIGEVSAKLLPPGAGAMFSEDMLKNLLLSQFGAGFESEVVQHVDLSRPLGCTMASPKKHSIPVACAVGYSGGVPQLIRDLGPEGYISGGADFAAYKRGETTFYLSSIDGHVIVAADPDLIGASRLVLQNFVVRDPGGGADQDITATAFPSVIWDDAREEIESLAGFADTAVTTDSGSPGLDAYVEGSMNSTLEAYKSFAELEQANFWIDLGRDGAEIGYRGSARQGTPTAESYAQLQAAGPIDTKLVRRMPADAAMLFGFSMDPSHMMDDPMVKPYVDLLGMVDGATGNTKFKSMMVDYLAVWSDIVSGQMASAVFWQPKGPFGAAYAIELKPGVDAPTKLRALFTDYSPAMMGDAFAKYVTWKVKRGAYKLDGASVDVLSIRPTKKGSAELAKLPGRNGLKEIMGPKSELKLAFTQRDGILFMGMSPRNEKRVLQEVLVNKDAGGRVGRKTLPGKLVSNHSASNLLMLADLGELLRLVARLDKASNAPSIRGRLDDFVLTGGMTAAGKHEYVFRMSQGAIDQVRDL